jgi:hypothetical protein
MLAAVVFAATLVMVAEIAVAEDSCSISGNVGCGASDDGCVVGGDVISGCGGVRKWYKF